MMKKTAVTCVLTGMLTLTAGVANADPIPGHFCTQPAKVTPQVEMSVCTHAWPDIDGGRHLFEGEIKVRNVSTGNVAVTLRADLLTDTQEYYGDICTPTLVPNQESYCTSRLVHEPNGAKRGRGRFQQGAYAEFFTAPPWYGR